MTQSELDQHQLNLARLRWLREVISVHPRPPEPPELKFTKPFNRIQDEFNLMPDKSDERKSAYSW